MPHGDGAALALCYEQGRVLTRREEAEGVIVETELPPTLLTRLARYRLPE